MTDDYSQLLEDIDNAEQLVFELERELRNFDDEESDDWYSVFREFQDAENHLIYLQKCQEDDNEYGHIAQ